MSKVMNLTTKLEQKEVLQRIHETDWVEGNSSPYVVELDLTAACDLACPGCISEDIISVGKKFTPTEVLRIGHEFIESGVRAVILIGGGEPLAHPTCGQFIELMGENGIHVGITTNGSFIDRYLGPISKYSKWTRVSIDAAKEETFEKLRPTKGGATNKFKKILANMRMLAKTKTGKLGFSFLIQTPADGEHVVPNVEEIYEAAVLAKEIGCDYFEVKPTYQFRNDQVHALMVHEEKYLEIARQQIARLDSLETDTFTILKAINLEASLSGVQVPQSKDYTFCPSAHLRTLVTPGGAFVCPYWRGKDSMQIGDCKTQSFKEVWSGEKRQEVMARLNPSTDCQFHCLRHATNVMAISLKEEPPAEEEFVEEFDRFI